MKLRSIAAAAALAAALPAVAQNKPIFIEFPPGSVPNDITVDGQVMTGTGPGNFRWTPATGVVGLGGIGSSYVELSEDGSAIAGGTTSGGNQSAGIWLGGTSWQALGGLGATGCPDLSSVYDISGDGTAVVGLGWNVCSARAFRWTAGSGMIDLGTLFPPRSTRANGVDHDGDVIVGWQDLTNGQRVAAKWVGTTESLILGNGGEFNGEAQNTNPDGSVIVGINCHYAGQGWVWTQGAGVQCIAGMSSAWDVSDDGQVIVGSLGAGPSMQGILSLDGTVLNLRAWLVAQNVQGVSAWMLLNAPGAVSGDGTVLAGWGLKDQPWPIGVRGFAVVLALAPPRLTLAKGPGGAILSWSLVTGAGRHDALRGELSTLLATGGDFSLATDLCLINSTAATTVTDFDVPPSGDGFWYLVRAEGPNHQGTYDSGGEGQVGARDAEIDASAFSCP